MLLYFPYISWYNLVFPIVEHKQAEFVCLQLEHEGETLRHLHPAPQLSQIPRATSQLWLGLWHPATCISCLRPLYAPASTETLWENRLEGQEPEPTISICPELLTPPTLFQFSLSHLWGYLCPYISVPWTLPPPRPLLWLPYRSNA